MPLGLVRCVLWLLVEGEALQAHFDVPVTTGHAGTTWCLYQNVTDRLSQTGQDRVAVVGASSPVGSALTKCYLMTV